MEYRAEVVRNPFTNWTKGGRLDAMNVADWVEDLSYVLMAVLAVSCLPTLFRIWKGARQDADRDVEMLRKRWRGWK